jgi:LuxR family maltose regulon positive regulatory protein
LHLIQHLEAGRSRKLTLISAPAGYGKSTLIQTWLASSRTPVAWLSLDPNDNDVGVFLLYLVSAVQTVVPTACNTIAALLSAPQLPPQNYLLQTIVGEMASLSQQLTLVLDDYHVIHNSEIHELVATCLQYQSSQLHLVIVTRQDPPFSISRLRVSEQMTELRLSDLKFTAEETHQYLERVVGEALSSELLDVVTQRTEGWPVGLRLISLVLQKEGDQANVVQAIRGTNRYIMEYLVDEVLAHQAEPVRRFLMYLSILDRFCVPLCDALLKDEWEEKIEDDQRSSQAMLAQLQEANLFLIALDTQHYWLRYHHLFQDLLRHRLQAELSPEELKALHAKAIAWLAKHGFYTDALEHALVTNDTATAVTLFARLRPILMNETRWQQLEQQLRRFPRAIVESEPSLYVAQVWLIYYQGRWNELATGIECLSTLLAKADAPPQVLQPLHGEMSTQIALVRFIAGDWDNAIASASLGLQHTPQELWIVRVLARGILSLSLQGKGQLAQAYQGLHESFQAELTDSELLPAPLLILICYVHWIAADLNAVIREAQQSITLSEKLCAQAMVGGGCYHLGAARYQQNCLSEAAIQFERITAQPYVHYHEFYVYGAIELTLTYLAQNRADEAQTVADQVLAYLLQMGNTTLLPVVEALQAELALRQGRLGAAIKWAKRHPEIPPLGPMFRPYEPHFTLIKIWLQQNTPRSRCQANALTTRLIDYLRSTHNTRYLIDALALHALQLADAGDKAAALATLAEAVQLAQPGTVIRAFADLGPAMLTLLGQLKLTDPKTQRFAQQILETSPQGVKRPALGNEDHPNSQLTESLTQREFEVLALLMQHQTDQDIARELYVSLNTVRTHTKHIYAKLKAHNRRQAVQKALELGFVGTR